MGTIKIIGADWDLVASPRREENEERSQMKGGEIGHNICGCCGKIITNLEERKSLRLIDGGNYFTEYDGELSDTHDMGWWYVGSVCYRKFQKNKKEIEVTE